jgi:hypothetical protein
MTYTTYDEFAGWDGSSQGLRHHLDPVGPDNDQHLHGAATDAMTVIFAEGRVENRNEDRADAVGRHLAPGDRIQRGAQPIRWRA